MNDELELLRNVSLVGRELSSAFDGHLRSFGLTTARGRVLLFLLPLAEGASQAEVTAHLDVEHPTAVRILDGLEALGHIQRVSAPEDRRAKIIVLTPDGREMAKNVSTLVRRLNSELIKDLNSEEMELVNGLLLKLLSRGRELRAAVAAQAAENPVP